MERYKTHPLFGRSKDLEKLHDRLVRSGLTAIVGPPQMGKSRLIRTLRDELRNVPDGVLVGYIEAQHQTEDLLLRAVVDFFDSWKKQSSFVDRVGVLKKKAHDYKGKTGSWAAETVSKVVDAMIVDADGPKAAGSMTRSILSNILSPIRTAQTGGVQVLPLDYDRTRELVQAVHQITGRPFVFMFDQWERSPNVAREGDQIKRFLDHLDEWPTCHFFVALRPEGHALERTDELTRDHARAVKIALSEMDLSDANESQRLLTYVRNHFASISAVPDETLLEWVGGNPAVIERWINSGEVKDNPDNLQTAAGFAHQNRYPELPKLIEAAS